MFVWSYVHIIVNVRSCSYNLNEFVRVRSYSDKCENYVAGARANEFIRLHSLYVNICKL